MSTDDYRPRVVAPPDPKVAEEICDRLAQGETLLKIIDTRPRPSHYPCRLTFYEWLRNDQQIAEMYDKARAAGMEVLAERCLEIAHEEIDKVEGKRDPGHIAHKKLQIDTHTKLLSKWSPKRYGDKMEVSGNAEQPLKVEVDNKIPVDDFVDMLIEAQRLLAEKK